MCAITHGHDRRASRASRSNGATMTTLAHPAVGRPERAERIRVRSRHHASSQDAALVAIGRRDERVDRLAVGRPGGVDDVLLTRGRRERAANDRVLDEVQQVGRRLPTRRPGCLVERGDTGGLSDAPPGSPGIAQFGTCGDDVLHDAVELQADCARRHEGELAQRLPDVCDRHARRQVGTQCRERRERHPAQQ